MDIGIVFVCTFQDVDGILAAAGSELVGQTSGCSCRNGVSYTESD